MVSCDDPQFQIANTTYLEKDEWLWVIFEYAKEGEGSMCKICTNSIFP